MKKDKPSRRKIKPEIPESKITEPLKREEPLDPIVEALMEGWEERLILSSRFISPFKKFADEHNPFLDPDVIEALVKHKEPTPYSLSPRSDIWRARLFSELVTSIYIFSILCNILLRTRHDDEISEAKEDIFSEKKKISRLLKLLIPKEAKKTLAHQFIRVCKDSPGILVYWVNGMVGTLQKCRKDAKKEYPQTYSTKKVLEIFCERVVPILYDLFVKYNQSIGIKPFWENKEELLKIISPAIIQDKNRGYSDTYTALGTTSIFANCSYDKLYDLYYLSRKKIKETNK